MRRNQVVFVAKPCLLNLFRLLGPAIKGQTIYIFDSSTLARFESALFPGFEFARRCLLKFSNVHDFSTLDERLAFATWYRDIILIADLFGRSESWLDRYFGFADVDCTLPEYSSCYRAMISSTIQFRHLEIFTVECVRKKFPGSDLRFVGLDYDTRAAIMWFSKTSKHTGGENLAVGRRILRRILNLFLAGVGGLFGLCRLARLIGWRAGSPRDCFLMADYIADPDDNSIYKAACPYGLQVMVPRSRSLPTTGLNLSDNLKICQRDDGSLPLSALPAVIARYVRALYRIYISLGWLNSPTFLIASIWPFKETQYESLFRKYRPKVFFARDPYNHDHILRHRALKKVGAKHIGINVGYPCYSIHFPTTRYVAFDTFLVYGRKLYDEHYADKWPTEMELFPVGPFRADREQFNRAKKKREGNDIAIFTGVFVREPGMIALVRGLAKAFPDRRIFLQVKPVFRDQPIGISYVKQCTAGLPNILPVTNDVYDILSEAAYSITDPSSIVVEAMSFGVESFLADVSDWQETCYFRKFDEIIVTSGHDAAAKIRALEAGALHYPWKRLDGVARLSNEYFVDHIERYFAAMSCDAHGTK